MNQTITALAAADSGSEVIAVARASGASGEELARTALRWARNEFADSLALLSSMGDEVLVHLASDEPPGIDVVFIDTGYHFAETIGTRDTYAATRPINLINITPVQSVPEQAEAYGEDLFARDPNLCCNLRKVEPLNPSRDAGYEWIGCAPWTRPVAEGEDSRSGRWAGSNKTECGLHT